MKKIFSLLLAIVMVLSLGSVAFADEAPILIGCYMPLTGTNAGSGESQIQGIQMALDHINANGGINGRMLQLKTYDSAGTTEGATKAATRLIEEDGVKIIAGSFLSSSVLAVSDITEKAHVLHVGTGTGATWTNIGLEYTFRATANGNLPVVSMVDELVDCGMTSIALISVASEYGQSGHDAVLAECAKNGIEVKADIIYQSSDTDFTGVIAKAMAAGADTIALYGLNVELAVITKQLRQNGYEDLIFTIEGGASAEMFRVAGRAADGVVFAAAYVIPDNPDEAATPMMKELLEEYYAQYKQMPFSEIFYRGYDQATLIAEALKNCDNPDDGESIANAFRAINGVELLGGSFDYTDGTGDGLVATNKWMIMDGKIQVYNKDSLFAWREAVL